MRPRISTIVLFSASLALMSPAGATAQSDDPAYNQFLFAKKLLERRENKDAAAAFDEYLQTFPNDQRRGDALYYRALITRQAGDSRAASALLADAPATTFLPGYALPLLRGQVHVDLGRFNDALAVLEAINLEPLPPAVRASVLHLQGIAYQGTNNLPAALVALDAGAAIDSPDRALLLFDKARAQAQMKQTHDAIDTLRQAIELGSTSTDTASSHVAATAKFAGYLSFAIGRYDEAAAFYRIVLEHHQSSAQFGPSVVGMLESQLAGKQYASTLETFEQYKATLPAAHLAVAQYMAGSARQALGQHEQALALLGASRRQVGSPVHAKALYKIAVSQYELGHIDDMGSTLEALQAQHPSSPLNSDGQFLRAAAEARQGDMTQGAARLTAIIDRGVDHPYHAAALLQRARLYETNERPKQAAEDYQAYLRLADHRDENGLFTRHEAALRLLDLQYQLGQYQQAAQTADNLMAGHADPLIKQDALFRRGLAQIRLKQFQTALDDLDDLSNRYPQNRYVAESHYYRGLVLMSMEKTDEAVDELLAAAASEKLTVAMRANALRVSAIHLRKSDEQERAVDALDQLARLTTLTPDESLWLGRYWSAHGNESAALSYLQPLVAAGESIPGPLRSSALYLTGQSLRNLGDHAAAVQMFEHVIALDQGLEAQAKLQLAATLQLGGRNDAALAWYAGLVNNADPTVAAEALFQSASIHRQGAEQQRRTNPAGAAAANDQARNAFKKLVVLYGRPELSPLPQLSYLHLAEIAADDNNQARVTTMLKELIEVFPNSAYASYARALLLVDQRKLGEARFLLRKLRQQELEPRLASRVEAAFSALERTP